MAEVTVVAILEEAITEEDRLGGRINHIGMDQESMSLQSSFGVDLIEE